MDDRVSALAEQVARVKTGIDFDFRLMVGALIAGALPLSPMMAKGFGWL